MLQTLTENFELILLILLLITGIIWFFDLIVLSRNRCLKLEKSILEFDLNSQKNYVNNLDEINVGREKLIFELNKAPAWIEYSGSFFPVILLVFVMRSFLFEPFKIPSESMLPTLFSGDYILVNKFTYGVRLPLLGYKVIEINNPKRGDVMVFKFPLNRKQNYIKRVVGVPGDKIVYHSKKLTINGELLNYRKQTDFLHDNSVVEYSLQYEEKLAEVTHQILNDESKPSYVDVLEKPIFPLSEQCEYDDQGFSCVVPKGHYFMMGDNRDNSLDSRYWGFVPENNIVGKAFFIWMNFNKLNRIGSFN
jgi:signal peptidase I